tara:strand:- start:200 stop:529 length:330 start_codon:yes stop_codon:yes gene_type:complete
MFGFKKIQQRMGINSNTQFVIIMIVFAITGSLALYLSKPILGILNINLNTLNKLLYYPLRLAVIFPIYQIALIIVGTLCGQFKFFWNLEKKMLNRLGLSHLLRIFKSNK